jgi:hypothetical protein
MKKILKLKTKEHYGYWRDEIELVAINVDDVNVNKLLASKLFTTGFTYGSIISGTIKTKGIYRMDNLHKRHLYCIAWKWEIDSRLNQRMTIHSKANKNFYQKVIQKS